MKTGFAFAAIFCLCAAICRIVKKKKYIPVLGTCIEIIRYEKDLFPRTKCCYKYNYHGIDYEYWESGFYYHVPKMEKGKSCKLFVCPNDFTKCISPSYAAVNRDLFILTIIFLTGVFVY